MSVALSAQRDVSGARYRGQGPALGKARTAVGPRLFRRYLTAAGVLAVCTFLSVVGAPILHAAAFIMVFPLGVLVVTARFGIGPAIFASAGGVLVFDFVFVPPAMAFAWPDLRDGLTLAVMLSVAAVASMLAEQLRRQLQSARRQAEIERLRNALLSALSHDLRTPLTSLVGASTALCENRLEPRERRQFSRMVAVEARRLSRLVNNLLELTRLESGRAHVKQGPQAIEEVIGSALSRLEPQLVGRRVSTDVPEAIPLVPFDPVLIEQVIINLVENIVHHAGVASPVEIAAHLGDEEIVVEVADSGPGVAFGDEERVFEKLYRARTSQDGGVGLGLTICQAIVTAHDGRIWLENRPDGGAVVRFTLPAGPASLAAGWPPSDSGR